MSPDNLVTLVSTVVSSLSTEFRRVADLDTLGEVGAGTIDIGVPTREAVPPPSAREKLCSAATVTKALSSPSSIGPQKQKGHHPFRMMAPLCDELVGTTSSGGEGASQKQPQAKQEDAKHQCEDRYDRHLGRQCQDAGVAADPRQVHEGGLWLGRHRGSKGDCWSNSPHAYVATAGTTG